MQRDDDATAQMAAAGALRVTRASYPLHIAAGAMVAALAGSAQGQPSETAAQQLAALHALVLDPARTFSISKTLAELNEIETRLGPESTDRGEVAFLCGLVEEKAGRAETSIPASIEALRIDGAHPFLSPEDRLMTNYRVAKQSKAQDNCQTAIPYYQRVVALMADDTKLTDGQRFGVRGDLGYCLHEVGKYIEARALNQTLLADSMRVFGPEDRRLLPTLINLAQNNYELHDVAAARASLQQVLAIATPLHDTDHVDTALFQLGVLAYENGEPDEARRLMRQRLRLAEQDGDADSIANAKRDLDILEEKLAH